MKSEYWHIINVQEIFSLFLLNFVVNISGSGCASLTWQSMQAGIMSRRFPSWPAYDFFFLRYSVVSHPPTFDVNKIIAERNKVNNADTTNSDDRWHAAKPIVKEMPSVGSAPCRHRRPLDVILTLDWRCDVYPTSIWRLTDVVCLLGGPLSRKARLGPMSFQIRWSW